MKRRSWLSSAFVLLAVVLVVTPAVALDERDRLFLVGERAVEDGLNALAARVLERFVSDNPTDPRVPTATLLLGRAWLGVGLHERALEAFRKVQTMSPPPGRPLEAKLWEGEALFRLKRFPDARIAFEEVAQSQTAAALVADATYGLAWIDLESRRPESAVKRFRDMLVAVPDHPLAPTATVTLARTLIDLKRYADAVTLLLDFAAKYPSHPLRPDAQYLLALARIRSGDTTTGVAELREFIDANPKHDLTPSARQLVGATVARSATRPQLQTTYQTLLNASPATPEGLYEAATIAGKLGQTREQETAWRRLRKEFPDHPLSRRSALDLANVAFKRKEWKEASTLARAAAPSDDDAVRAEAWLLAGEADLKQKRFADAVKAFGGAQDIDGVDASVRYRALAGLGLAHEELQHWRPALSAYEEVAGKSPDSTLRSWAQDRAKAVKARLTNPPSGKAGDAKPGNAAKPKSKS